MKNSLRRITTRYSKEEDRLCLAGQVEGGATVVIWLTCRLLRKLVPVLLRWLEQRELGTSQGEVLQGFAQMAALADLKPQSPVRVEEAAATWLAQAVDISLSEKGAGLRFRGEGGQEAHLVLEAKPLRQWLGILHEFCVKAGWPLDAWPAWFQDFTLPTVGRQPEIFH